MAAEILTIRRPDDWHVHLRDGAMLAAVAPLTARQFARAIVMPNLVPPVTSVAAAKAYKKRILDAVGTGAGFTPLMTCYLTDTADADEIARGHEEGIFTAVKLYPAHATTNSDAGVTDIANVYSALERLEKIGMPLLVHGETVDAGIDVFDRERVFIERTLAPLMKKFPGLKIVFEHITSKEAAAFVVEAPATLAATVTAHHLMIDRNAIFQGGIRPHYYCLPIAKREEDRRALRKAAASGSAKFFLGTDTAPHAVSAKENACGCAGIFTAANALELYTQVFDEENALEKFEAFASLNGPAFYGLPVNEGTVTLIRKETEVPKEIEAGGEAVRPFLAGQTLSWSVEG
ncbi:MAG: dihydroorotase [Rhodospirillales bacterium]